MIRASARGGSPRCAPQPRGRKPAGSGQMARIEAALRQGARAHGCAERALPRWRGHQETERRAIGRGVGVSGALDWTSPRPARSASERNEASIQLWITTRWIAVKTLGSARLISTRREGRLSGRRSPSARHAAEATAPRPCLRKKLSSRGRGVRWDFRRSGLFFQTRPGSYNDVTLIEFLTDLKREFRGSDTRGFGMACLCMRTGSSDLPPAHGLGPRSSVAGQVPPCSIRTMYRVLAAHAEVRERRNQLRRAGPREQRDDRPETPTKPQLKPNRISKPPLRSVGRVRSCLGHRLTSPTTLRLCAIGIRASTALALRLRLAPHVTTGPISTGGAR